MKTETLVRIAYVLVLMPALSGCIITPRVEMTERIDFNYHGPAVDLPMNFEDKMCNA